MNGSLHVFIMPLRIVRAGLGCLVVLKAVGVISF